MSSPVTCGTHAAGRREEASGDDMSGWTAEDIPDLTGKTIIVTGGNSGIGYEAALQLAGKRANVVLACRDPGRAGDAVERIRSAHPKASVDVMALDLASLASVRSFAEAFSRRHDRLDVLCNNAGVMALPYRRTADGFEMQLGTNHLGHFALTGLLLERLLSTAAARVVNVSSTAHRMGKMRFDDLQWEHGYGKWRAYGQSKLANLLFTYELQRRLAAAKANAHQRRLPSGLCRHQPADRRPAHAGLVVHGEGIGARQRPLRPERRHGRAADAVRRDGARCARRRLHRPGRLRRGLGPPEEGRLQRAARATRRTPPACGRSPRS